jgi:hypothetical protein
MENRKLGKQDYKHDDKTLILDEAISEDVVVPHSYDFDNHRFAFPLAMWGNDRWGDCVKVAECNEIIRLERLELRKTLPIMEADVVSAYRAQTGSNSPGDENDTGLVMLDNNRRWRKEGFLFRGRAYKIAAFGEISASQHESLKAAIYLLHGVQLGFALPLATRHMTNTWDIPAGATLSGEWASGSWGGHAVYAKRYDETGIEILTWGEKVHVTWAFLDTYCDEAWAVVDSFDSWRHRPEIDVQKIINHLKEIGATGIEA